MIVKTNEVNIEIFDFQKLIGIKYFLINFILNDKWVTFLIHLIYVTKYCQIRNSKIRNKSIFQFSRFVVIANLICILRFFIQKNVHPAWWWLIIVRGWISPYSQHHRYNMCDSMQFTVRSPTMIKWMKLYLWTMKWRMDQRGEITVAVINIFHLNNHPWKHNLLACSHNNWKILQTHSTGREIFMIFRNISRIT